MCASRANHDKESKDLMNQIRDLTQKHEAANGQGAELKVQVRMQEEARDSLKHDLIDANNRIHEGISH